VHLGTTLKLTHARRAQVYIIEVGAGHGRMSFLLVTALLRLAEFFPPTARPVPFVYVMTDFARGNVEHWKGVPALAALAARGVLEFAVYDAETDVEASAARRAAPPGGPR
jgi:hypothetical protein